eukprot:scaffold1687_cov405-Prasinococcus_capsulatus_cf.AAC.16
MHVNLSTVENCRETWNGFHRRARAIVRRLCHSTSLTEHSTCYAGLAEQAQPACVFDQRSRTSTVTSTRTGRGHACTLDALSSMPALARAAIVPVLLVLCVACKGDLRSGPRVAVSPTAAHSRPDPSEAVLSSESDLSDHGTHRGLRHLSAEAAEGERVSDKLTQLLKRSPLLKQHSESVGRNTRKEKTTDNATDPDKGLASIRGHKLTREQMFELLDGDDPAEFPSFKQRVGRIFSFVDPSGEAGGNGQHRTSPFVDEHSFKCQPTMAGRSSEMQIHVGHTTYTADTYLRWNEDATRHIFR